MVAFGQKLTIDPMSVCHFQCCGEKRCVVVITKVICPLLELKYPHGDFETLDDLLQCDVIDRQAQRMLWDCEEIVPKHYFNNILQTFIQGEIVNMLSLSEEVLAIGKFKGYVQNILCMIEITKLTLATLKVQKERIYACKYEILSHGE